MKRDPEHALVVFVVGAPGAGKTTLVRSILTRACAKDPGKLWDLVPKPKWTIVEGICAAGHYKGDKFDGADTIPYNGAADVFDYWFDYLSHLVTFLDGDRLSDVNTLHRFRSTGADTRCISLVADAHLLAERRALRGSTQNAAWMKGRATKAQRFALNFPNSTLSMPASWTIEQQLAVVDDFLKE